MRGGIRIGREAEPTEGTIVLALRGMECLIQTEGVPFQRTTHGEPLSVGNGSKGDLQVITGKAGAVPGDAHWDVIAWVEQLHIGLKRNLQISAVPVVGFLRVPVEAFRPGDDAEDTHHQHHCRQSHADAYILPITPADGLLNFANLTVGGTVLFPLGFLFKKFLIFHSLVPPFVV